MGGWGVVVRCTEAGTNAKNSPQVPWVCVSPGGSVLPAVEEVHLVFSKPGRRAGSKNPCHRISFCQSSAQFNLCPHPASLVLVPSCTQSCLAVPRPAPGLAPGACAWVCMVACRAATESDGERTCHLMGPWMNECVLLKEVLT